MASLPIAAPTPVVVPTTSQPWNDIRRQQREHIPTEYLNVLKWLGIIEVIMGFFCLIFGAVMIDKNQDANTIMFYHDISTFGEGIWGGIWIIITGGIGIAAGKRNSNVCIINVDLNFNIIGTIFTAALVILSAMSAKKWEKRNSSLSNYWIFELAVSVLIAVVSFACFIIQIISAVYCCKAKQTCGAGCCWDNVIRNEQAQVRYSVTSAQTPGNQNVLFQMQVYPYPQGQQPVYIVQQPQILFQPHSQVQIQPQLQIQQLRFQQQSQQQQLQFQQQPQQQLRFQQPQQHPQQQQSIDRIDFQPTDANQDDKLPTYENAAFQQSCSDKETALPNTSD